MDSRNGNHDPLDMECSALAVVGESMTNKQLAYVLLSFAADFGAAGPQYAALCSVLRQGAERLERCDASDQVVSSPVADASADLVLDDDGVPLAGRPCPSCAGD